MSRRFQRGVSLTMAMLFSLMSVVSVAAYHEDDETTHAWADPRFEERWERTDLPVLEGEVARTWVWGPSPYTGGMMEPYLEAPGGERLVQYTDKSRMELLDPSDDDNDLWSVTQGLLALDMMLGRVQIGDDAFATHSEGASNENVAGDPGEDNGPTYATMAGTMDADARAEDAYIVDWLAADGTITTDNELANYDVTAEHNVNEDWIDHTIASVFWEFMNSEGTVWDGDSYETDNLFQNPYYAVGYPVTEAYWTNVKVDGADTDVLVQCFERRCLTYAPENPEGWMVEAGNVGQHYYRWLQTHQGVLVPSEVLGQGLVGPRGVEYTDEGVYVAEAGSGGDTCVTIEEEFEGEVEEFEICVGLSSAVTLITDDGQSRIVEGLPSLVAGEDSSGAHDVTFDNEGNMYIVIGMGGPPEARDLFGETGELLATVVRVEDNGDLTVIADLAQYEADENPEDSMLDTNPYSIAFDGENLIVTDAGGNSLLRVDPETGDIETIAIFEQRMVEAPPFLGMEPGAMMPMDSVPTGVVVGADGNYYVGELTGFPFPVGGANVYQVTPDGDVEVFAEGLTNVGDLAFDSDGELYALEIVSGGLLNADQEAVFVHGDFSSIVASIIHVDDDGTTTDLMIPGLYFATGLAIGAQNEFYVNHMSVTPMAETVRIDLLEQPDGTSFSTSLSGDEEVPAVTTTATGSATFVLSEDSTSIDYEVNVADIDDVTMAHIHMAPAGENGGVVVWLYPSAPPAVEIPGTTTGLLAEGTITADDLVGSLEGMGLDALIDAIEAGDTYVNVHTTTHGGGEIRGQIALD